MVEPPDDDTSSSSCLSLKEKNTNEVVAVQVNSDEQEFEDIQIVQNITDKLISDVVTFEHVKNICMNYQV